MSLCHSMIHFHLVNLMLYLACIYLSYGLHNYYLLLLSFHLLLLHLLLHTNYLLPLVLLLHSLLIQLLALFLFELVTWVSSSRFPLMTTSLRS